MKSGFHIAFFGSSLVSAYWNGAATYYRGIARSLHARGHSMTFYEPDAFERQRHRDIPDPPWAHVVVYDPHDKCGVERLVQEAGTADVLVKASGVGVLDEFLEEAVADRKRPGLTTIFWDVDAPATLQRLADDPEDRFRALVPRYDLILTYGGGHPVVRAYTAFGAKCCVPIYNALDASTHFPVTPDERFVGDVGLLANRLPDREARVEEFFFKPALRLAHRRFLLGGNGWSGREMPSNVRYVDHVYTRHHNAFNSTAGVILNVNRDSMARNGYSPATRIFEAAGAGACVISDAWEGIELFFEPGREILLASDAAGVAELLESSTPTFRQRVGAAARQRALAEHTYDARALLVEMVLDGSAVTSGKTPHNIVASKTPQQLEWRRTLQDVSWPLPS